MLVGSILTGLVGNDTLWRCLTWTIAHLKMIRHGNGDFAQLHNCLISRGKNKLCLPEMSRHNALNGFR